MLNLMSVFHEKENFIIFFEKYGKIKTKIFEEIYLYLGGTDFISKKDFKEKYKEILSHESNKSKVLSSGLILKIYDKVDSTLLLTDQEYTFSLVIDFIKKIIIKNKNNNKKLKDYIISKTCYNYYYNVIKKIKLKYKLKSNNSELSLSSNNLEKIIYNKNLEYLVSYPNYDQIYEDIFKILRKEKELKSITPIDFFNKYRIINYPEIDVQYVNKMKWKAVDFDDYCWGYKYLYYNSKIGLSVALEKYFIQLYQRNKKIFYLNVDYLFNETDTQKVINYLYFYLSFLFSVDEKDSFINFIENCIINLIYEYKGAELIKNILQLLHEKFKEFKLYIDNVKSFIQFYAIKDFVDSNKHEDVLVFIQLNLETIYIINKIFKYNLIDNLEIGQSITDNFENYFRIIIGLKSEKSIEDEYSDKLKIYFKNYDINNLLYILNIKNLLNSEYSHYSNLTILKSFIEFVYIKINKYYITKIYFRNNYIKTKFNDYYLNYITKFKNMDKNIFYTISKLEEGINLENQIIFDLIVNNNDINKIKVDKIFSIEKFPDINFNINEEYLFIQENINSPYYVFAFLYYKNGLIILKCSQIGINKNRKDLKKLDLMFLLLDLYYFAQKIKYEKSIKIDKLELCIITTKNAYDEEEYFLNKKIKSDERKYKNFNVMREFCVDNNFTFFIFSTQDSNFYRIDNNKLIKTDLKYSDFQFDVKKIFIKDEYIFSTKKLNYYFDHKNKNKIGQIELPLNFCIENLNKEFNYIIKNNVAIYVKKFDDFNIENDDAEDSELKKYLNKKYNRNSESESMNEDYDDDEYKNSEIDYDDEEDYKEESEDDSLFSEFEINEIKQKKMNYNAKNIIKAEKKNNSRCPGYKEVNKSVKKKK